MDTRLDRRTRREQQRRLATVTAVSVIAVVLTLLLASCAREHEAGAPRPLTRAALLRDERVRAVERLRTAAAYTTTTTRPVVNPALGPPPPNSGAGKRIVYCNSCQTAWLVDATNYVIWEFKVSGHRGMPAAGTYHVFHTLEMGRSKHHPDLRLPFFVGFAWGPTTDIGFHGIPLRPDGSQIEADSQLGQPLSSGCVRVSQAMARAIYDFAPAGTTVVVTA